LEVRRDWNTLLIALYEPFTVPGTDLQAKELQIEIPGWSVELDAENDDTDPNEDQRDDVTVHFLEPRVLVQHQAEESIGWDMRSTTRKGCTIIGPVVSILTEGEYDPPGGLFSLQLSLPSSVDAEAEATKESQGEGDRAGKRFVTLWGTHSREFEAVKLISAGSECFCRILSANTSNPVDDAEDGETPPTVSSALGVAPVDFDDGLSLLQDIDSDGSSGVISQEPISFGPGDSISDAQVFFYCPSSAGPFDWRSRLTPLSVARGHILNYRDQTGQSGDDDDSDSDRTFREDGSDTETVVGSNSDIARALGQLGLEH
jgi:hypothetical protein